MSGSSEEAVAIVARLFVGMGAEQTQGETMARQLLKRAGQLSAERGISKVEATDILLRQIAEARAGKTPERQDDHKA